MLSKEGAIPATRVDLDAKDDTVALLVSLSPRALTWFVITEATSA